MRLGYFSMPLHPLGRTWQDTLREDREAVILADQLGFHDAFIGEHLTDRHENITNSLVFLATLIHDTSSIRLGTGTTNLSQQHPVLVAANSAMFDHLSDGRFILGISPGALATDAEVLGILDEDRNAMFAEAIDVITAIWESEPPYDIAFLDPPYPLDGGAVDADLTALASNAWLVPGALVVVERSARSAEPTWPDGLDPIRSRRYGETVLWYGHAATATED